MKRSALPFVQPVGAAAEVPEAQAAAGERVDGGAGGRAVVGHDRLDGDAMAGVERIARCRNPIAVMAFSSLRTST
jgi:hypothetical protein